MMLRYKKILKVMLLLFSLFAGMDGLYAQQRYNIAAVDLMMLKRQKVGAIQLASQVGVQGLEVDMGGLGNRPTFDNQLLNDSIRAVFIQQAKAFNISFCSLSMSGYYAQSFCGREAYLQSIEDCIQTMKLMSVKVGFLPMGVQCDLVKHPELMGAVISRLKQVGKMAEAAGVVIGIETALDARAEKKLLQQVGSKGIKSYFNFSNPLKNGRDLCKELKILGRKNIIQIHCTDDDGVLLKDNTRLDMIKVKQTLDKMGWSGWLVLERSRDAKEPNNVKKNFGSNAAYMKSIFQ
jgi:sugar phosphate isomerase/epimerase